MNINTKIKCIRFKCQLRLMQHSLNVHRVDHFEMLNEQCDLPQTEIFVRRLKTCSSPNFDLINFKCSSQEDGEHLTRLFIYLSGFAHAYYMGSIFYTFNISFSYIYPFRIFTIHKCRHNQFTYT